MKQVNLSLRLLSRPDVLNLPTIFTSLGTEYDEKVLPSIGNEVLKAVVAQFNADQLLTDRFLILFLNSCMLYSVLHRDRGNI